MTDIVSSYAGCVEIFSTLHDFVAAIAKDHSNPYGSGQQILRPTALLDSGAGARCEYVSDFGTGFAEVFRLFPGVLMVLHEGCFGEQSQVNALLTKSQQLDGHYCVRLVDQGEIALRFGQSVRRVNRDSGLVYRYPQNQDTDFLCTDNTAHRYAHFLMSEDGIAHVSNRLGIPLPSIFGALARERDPERRAAACPGEGTLTTLAESLWTRQLSGVSRAAYLRLKVGELFCLLGQTPEYADIKNHADLPFREIRKLNDARDLLDQRFSDAPSIRMLASEVGLNKRKLTEGFKHLFGETVSEYTGRLRLEHAYTRIMTTNEPLADVAEQCGYNYFSNFSRAFKKRFQKNPADIRKAR